MTVLNNLYDVATMSCFRTIEAYIPGLASSAFMDPVSHQTVDAGAIAAGWTW